MDRGEWEKLVGQWRRSGQTARQFAMGRGVTDSALRYWAGRIGRDAAAHPKGGSEPIEAEMVAPTIARVVRPGEAPSARLSLVIGQVTILVEPGFDEGHLRHVVRTLSEVG